MRRPAARLSTRIAVVVAALVPVAVLLAGAVLMRFAERDLLALQDRELREGARVVAPLADELLAADRPALRVAAEGRAALSRGGIRIEAPGVEPVVVGDIPEAEALPDRQGRPVTVDADGRAWRVLTVDVPNSPARLWVGAPMNAIDDQLALLRRRIVVIGLLAGLAAGVAGLALGRRLTRPLRALQRRAAEVSTGGKGQAPMQATSGVDEVDTLAETLNELLANREAQQRRTEEALQSARSFSATAAHELRTPLMSIKTNLDVLTAHADLSSAERAEVVADLHGEHGRILNVLHMLRALAQGELLDSDAFAPVDFADVVDQAVDAARRRYPASRISMTAPDELRLNGWAEGLRLICDNLLTNAIVHGATISGAVDVAVVLRTGPAGEAVLIVDDSGPGVPPAQRSVAFDRFHRRPGSPGCGLGLTVTAQQVRLHGGQIQLLDNPGGPGTRALVRLPTAAG